MCTGVQVDLYIPGWHLLSVHSLNVFANEPNHVMPDGARICHSIFHRKTFDFLKDDFQTVLSGKWTEVYGVFGTCRSIYE